MRHSLSYTHADQALLRDTALDEYWDGLVVPGTLATYYFGGTGGFVLTLQKPYLIDPRTPLLQTMAIRRPPRASHLKLAEVHDPAVVGTWPEAEIPREHWEDGRWPDVVRRVLEFQVEYSTSATDKLDKYNKLRELAGREPMSAPPLDPMRLIPPYWAVLGVDDPWWALTKQALEFSLAEHPDEALPVITLRSRADLSQFADLIRDLPAGCDRVYCWASDWNEADATRDDIEGWLAAIAAASEQDVTVCNLYGGALSVLLTARGLAGVNHGIGYSESRDSDRLAATGAPQTRYYHPALREFLTVPNAQPAIDHLPAEWACNCDVCGLVIDEAGRPQVGRLSSEQLKRHFLISRHSEFVRVDADFDAEVANLVEVGSWVVDNERPALSARHGERLLTWAHGITR